MSVTAKPLIIPIFIPHAGCPHFCVFCNQRAITGSIAPLPTSADIRSVVHEFLSYKKDTRTGVELSFYGGNFLGLPTKTIQDFLDQASEFAGAGQIDSIRFSTRPDTVDEDRLNIIRPYPVSTVELGVQSMDDGVLRQAGRGHTATDAVNAVTLLKKNNYRIGLQMMTGLPGDTDARCLCTVQQIIALKPDFVRIYPTLVICGSRLAELYRQGHYAPQSLGDCLDLLKTLVLLFQRNQIRVIRMGLQASDGLDDPAIVLAGPYHPALGHMVYSKILLDIAAEKLNVGQPPGQTVTITVHPRNLSRMQGLNKTNIEILKRRFHIQTLHLATDSSLDRDSVRVE